MRYPPDDPREWLNRARSNLKVAGMNAEGIYLEDLCFNAQQAAEKAIKAVLVLRKVEFPYVHDIARLLALVEGAGQDVPESVWDADGLTPFAVITRYPDMAPPMDIAQYRELVAIAERVLAWAEGIVMKDMEP